MLEHIKRLSEKSKLDTQLKEARNMRSKALHEVLAVYLEQQKNTLIDALRQHDFEVVEFAQQRIIKAEVGNLMLKFQLPDLGTHYWGALAMVELSVHDGSRRKEFKFAVKLADLDSYHGTDIVVNDKDSHSVTQAIESYRDLSNINTDNLESQLFEIPIMTKIPMGVGSWDQLTDLALMRC